MPASVLFATELPAALNAIQKFSLCECYGPFAIAAGRKPPTNFPFIEDESFRGYCKYRRVSASTPASLLTLEERAKLLRLSQVKAPPAAEFKLAAPRLFYFDTSFSAILQLGTAPKARPVNFYHKVVSKPLALSRQFLRKNSALAFMTHPHTPPGCIFYRSNKG